jgi:urease accessory protein
MTSLALLVLLGDGRLPTGGHVHSAGLEQARADGRLADLDDLERLLRRRLATAGRVAAAVAASACHDPHRHGVLDVETDARTPSAPQREASRAQGRGMLRLAQAAWPGGVVPGGVVPGGAVPGDGGLDWGELGRRPHQAVVLGCAARAGGLRPVDAATCAAHLAVTGPASAAQRLLALDPVAVAALTVRLASAVDAVVASLPDPATDPADLPSDSDPLSDLLAGRHALAPDRLFAS